MKALSLLQPWASLVIVGAKRWETRSWRAPRWVISQTIAIHASKKFGEEERTQTLEPSFSGPLKADGLITLGDVPRGVILGTVRVQSCWEVEGIRHELSETEREYGNYFDGRFAWELVDLRRLVQPIPARGALGLWPVPPEIEAEFRFRPGIEVRG